MSRCPTCWRRVAGGECSLHGSIPILDVRGDATEQQPPTIAGYDVRDLLGVGGFASVWTALRKGSGSPVALKVALSRVDEQRRRLGQEARALEAVGSVAPAVYEVGTTGDGRAYIAMDLLRGTSLAAQLCERSDDETWTAQRDVAEQLATAVAKIADSGWVHGDLKPENIFITTDGALRLLDFGIATEIGVSAPAAGSIEYMAPERLRGEDMTPAADVYGVGVVLFELLSGRPPFVGDRATVETGHLTRRAPSLRSLVRVSAAMEQLCVECLSKAPNARPPIASLLERTRAAFDDDVATQKSAVPTGSSLLESETQSAVLVALELGTDQFDLDELLSRAHASIARQQGHQVICHLDSGEGSPTVRGLDLAIAAASAGCRATIHVAEVTVKQGRRGRRVRGAAIDASSDWLAPPCEESSVHATAAAAEALGDRVVLSTELPGFWRPRRDSGSGDVEFIGHRTAFESARRAIDGLRGPGLVTVLAAPGLGRSRLLRELAMTEQRRDVVWLQSGESSSELGERLRAQARDAPMLVLVDDVHRCTDDVLDAIEFATLDGEAVELAVACTATDRLLARRPDWGERAETASVVRLEALAEADAVSLAAAFLRPADYLPQAFLKELGRFCGASPALLREVIGCLKRDGQLVARGLTGSFTVASAALDTLRTSPAEGWLLRTKLATLPSEFAALARIAAVLGANVHEEALAAVLESASNAGESSSPLDAAIGLAGLADAGVVAFVDDQWWRFTRRSFQAALESEVAVAVQTRLHQHALEFWSSADLDDEQSLAALAASAQCSGDHSRAKRVHARLGRRALAANRLVDAERHFSNAIELERAEPAHSFTARSFTAHLARGTVRYRMHRTDEALTDFEAALCAARDDSERAEAHLEAAVALDWADRFPEAEARFSKVQGLFESLAETDKHRLEARRVVAAGRVAWRKGDLPLAIERLAHGCQLATECGDDTTLIAGLLLVGPAQVFAGDLPAAEHSFATVIARCQAAADRFHLATAYSNRSFLWSSRGDSDALVHDLDRAIDIARQIGQPMLERAASHNLAEFLGWQGQFDRALKLAERADRLRERFVGAPQVADSLLLARIHACLGDANAVRTNTDTARLAIASDEPPVHHLLLRALQLWLGDRDAEKAWAVLVTELSDLPAEERIEIWDLMRRWAARIGHQELLAHAQRSGTEAVELAGVLTTRWQGFAYT